MFTTIGIGLLIENPKTDTFELNSVYNPRHGMDFQRKKTRGLTSKSESQFSILLLGLHGDFYNSYLPKIEFFET